MIICEKGTQSRIENLRKKLANDHYASKPKADVYGFENMFSKEYRDEKLSTNEFNPFMAF